MDHLSRLSTQIFAPILDSFSDEHILEIKTNSLTCYAHIVNSLVMSKLLGYFDFNDRNFLLRYPILFV